MSDHVQQYQLLSERYKNDGEIFWNKITVLITVNVALLGFLSLKSGHRSASLFSIVFILSGIFFTLYWWIVLFRQADWVKYWQETILGMEEKKMVPFNIQTEGKKHDEGKSLLKLGSFNSVTHILPMFFIFLWLLISIFIWPDFFFCVFA